MADPTRRLLLDKLHERDGQTLSELEVAVAMSRFGVMKHLKVLEAAHLVVTRKVGRQKFHYLNGVPIQAIADRWIGKFRRPILDALSQLKHDQEAAMAKPKHVYEIFIRTTPEKLWEAITRPEFTEKYFYGTRVRSEFTPGSRIEQLLSEGTPMLEGEVLEYRLFGRRSTFPAPRTHHLTNAAATGYTAPAHALLTTPTQITLSAPVPRPLPAAHAPSSPQHRRPCPATLAADRLRPTARTRLVPLSTASSVPFSGTPLSSRAPCQAARSPCSRWPTPACGCRSVTSIS